MKFCLIIGCLLAAGTDAPQSRPDPAAVARRIDARLAESFKAGKIIPAPRAGNAEFLRRLTLDLWGRIPTESEVREFLSSSGSGDVRAGNGREQIGRMLNDPQHARHFAHIWRAALLPEAETDRQIRYFQPGLEAWLEQRRREKTGFDAIVRELLTVPLPRPNDPPQFVLRDLHRPNPVAFIAGKEADPAKIASSSLRLFLGLRLECAQCHNHPFDHWTRKQFWNQAAFFAGIERLGKKPGAFTPLVETPQKRTISAMTYADAVPALFLDEAPLKFAEGQSPRVPFAAWLTSPQNPYFAKAIVNRVWAQLLGKGIVDPVDDFRDSNAPTHPELLKDLADAFTASGFDLGFLYRAVCLSEAYQRTSRQSHSSQLHPEDFARGAVKPLSSEQFFDSLAQAIEYVPASPPDHNDSDPVRRQVMEIFQAGAEGDPETSVVQALTLMNGELIQKAATPALGSRLKRMLVKSPDAIDWQRQVETLYLATLSRLPTSAELQTIGELPTPPGTSRETAWERRLGDVFWMLLNSAEFRWNH